MSSECYIVTMSHHFVYHFVWSNVQNPTVNLVVFSLQNASTVQLGYCDSDVTVCLLFWNMPIIQDRDVEYPYKQYISYFLAF